MNEKAQTELKFAAFSGNTAMALAAIKAGADVNWRRKKNESTPLLLAAGWRHPELVSVLIKAGADLEARNEKGHTPLMTAADSFGGDGAATVSALIAGGADINAKGRNGETALTLAAMSYGECDVEPLVPLISAGADVAYAEAYLRKIGRSQPLLLLEKARKLAGK